MNAKSVRRLLAAIAPSILIWTVSAQPSLGQRITGDIIGTITDSSGSAIPRAKVHLRSLDMGRQMDTSATDTGDYSFVELKPGRYEVMAESEGFERKAVSGISLSADQRARGHHPCGGAVD
jgi:hypothetical protein